MKRTQIYITEEQDRLLSARARDAGTPKAEIIRRILDSGLGLGEDVAERRRALRDSAGALADEPGWEEWLDAVRGGGAADRLDQLGS